MSDPAPPTEDSPEVRKIARGGNPEWEHTFEHPEHGPLTFRGRLPKAMDLLEHQVEIDNRLGNLDGPPRVSTMLLVAALAGMTPLNPDQPGRGLLLDLPVISETRTEDPDTGRVSIKRTFYRADDEPNTAFLIDVWSEFSEWRASLLGAVDAVKGPSGETAGNS